MFRIVKVTYTARPEYVEKNKENIAKVMSDLRKINNPAIRYATYLMEDGKTFMHFAHFDNEEGQKILNSLESFKKFGDELKASGPETPPKPEQVTLVASCYDIFPG